MTKRLLLTSFDIWLPSQPSNSADDLLNELTKSTQLPDNFTMLRHLPVNVEIASRRVFEAIERLHPDVIICCGMAVGRQHLEVESNASSTAILPVNSPEKILHTKIDLNKLVVGTAAVKISHDCGKFVCEGLYYSVLNYHSHKQLNSNCIFIHVPILTTENLTIILGDFLLIIDRLALW